MAKREEDEIFMREALREAKQAGEAGEVPVGAVIVYNGKIISRGRNAREHEKNALCHAEIAAIDGACRARGGWRLFDCTMYVTLEPCPMCAGAVINARLSRVVYGAKDARAGAFGSVINMCSYPLTSKPELECGILGDECAAILSDFFSRRRRLQSRLPSR